MIGKLIGAGLGAAISKETRKIEGPTGAVLGFLAVPLLTRLRLPTMLALAGGGYIAKKLIDKEHAPRDTSPRTATTTPITPASTTTTGTTASVN